MPRYFYKAKKNVNETVEGVVEELSRDAVVSRLASQGLTPVSVVLQDDSKIIKSAADSLKPQKIRKRRISLKDISLFTRQLHTLVKSRLELLSALRILQDQQDNLAFRNIIQDLFNSIKDGSSFSQALSKHGNVFSRLYVNLITSGEASGKLDEGLDQLCIYLNRIEDLRMKLRQALAYPLLMIMVGIISIFVLITFVIPRLSVMFSNYEMTLPLPTRILLDTANFLKNWWIVIVVAFAAVTIIFLRSNLKNKLTFLDQLKYRLPIIKKLIYKQGMVNFTVTLSLLLRSGISLLEALRISIPLLGDKRLIQELESAREKVKDGSTLSQGLQQTKFLPSFLVHMVRVGEAGGRLEETMGEIANSYAQELESDLKIVSSLIEPLIILFLGVIIGGVVISMLLPIFQINTMAQ